MLTIDVTPETDALLVQLASFAESEHHLRLTGSHDTICAEEAVPRMEYRVEHGLVEERVPHPLGDDDVDLFVAFRQLDVFHLAADDAAMLSVRQSSSRHNDLRDDILEFIVLNNLFRLLGDVAGVHREYMFCTRFGGEQGEDTSSAADVHDHCVFEKVLI